MNKSRKSLYSKTAWMVAVAMLTLTGAAQAQRAGAGGRADPPPGEYRVVDGRVDRGTYTGWRLFHTSCHGCHGVDALGTDVAPNLVQRVRNLTPRAFVTKVLTSYRIAQGPEGAQDREAMIDEVLTQRRSDRSRVVMPAWETDRTVNPHVLDLFAYLNARADDKLGPGRPRLMREAKRGAPNSARQ